MHFAHTPPFSIRKVDVGKKSTTVVLSIDSDALPAVEPLVVSHFLTIRALPVGHLLIDVDVTLDVFPEEG